MRIFIATIDEPFYVPIFLKDVIAEFQRDIVGISIFSPFAKKTISKGISESPFRIIKTRLQYHGIVDVIKQSLFFVIYKILDKIVPINYLNNGRFYSVHRLAKFYRLNQLHCPSGNINDSAYIDRLHNLNVDIIICLIPQVVKKQFLESASIGCLNIHCGLLPKNRGREPLFWAMLNQESFTGVTIHFMDERLDSGPILKQQKFEIRSNDTLHSLYMKATRLGSRLMIEGLKDLRKANFYLLPNNDEIATYNDWPGQEAIKKFRRLRKRFY